MIDLDQFEMDANSTSDDEDESDSNEQDEIIVEDTKKQAVLTTVPHAGSVNNSDITTTIYLSSRSTRSTEQGSTFTKSTDSEKHFTFITIQ